MKTPKKWYYSPKGAKVAMPKPNTSNGRARAETTGNQNAQATASFAKRAADDEAVKLAARTTATPPRSILFGGRRLTVASHASSAWSLKSLPAKGGASEDIKADGRKVCIPLVR